LSQNSQPIEKQGGEVREPASKKQKTGPKNSKVVDLDLDLNSMQKRSSISHPRSTSSLLKPTTAATPSQNTAPVKTLSLSDYKRKKSAT